MKVFVVLLALCGVLFATDITEFKRVCDGCLQQVVKHIES